MTIAPDLTRSEKTTFRRKVDACLRAFDQGSKFVFCGEVSARAHVLLIASALVLTALGCGHSPTPQELWFTERGRQSTTWHVCLQMAAELRSACGGSAVCETKVTRELIRPCYAGRYHQEASHSKREARVERLSPCFWDTEAKKAASPAEYAKNTCSNVVDARLRPACVAELREVIEGICTEGAPDLTGAGP